MEAEGADVVFLREALAQGGRVRRVAEDGVTDRGEMDTELVGAAGVEFAVEECGMLRVRDRPVRRLRIPRTVDGDDGHLRPLEGRAADRRVDDGRSRGGDSRDEGEVHFFDRALLELLLERAVCLQRLRDEQAAGRLPVEAVDEHAVGRKGDTALRKEVGNPVEDRRFLRWHPRSWVDCNRRRLTEDEASIILVEGREVEVDGLDIRGWAGGFCCQCDFISFLEALRGLSDNGVIDEDEAALDRELGLRAAGEPSLLREEGVEALGERDDPVGHGWEDIEEIEEVEELLSCLHFGTLHAMDREHSELLTRAVEDVVPRDLAEGKLRSGEKLRVYLGIDPTGSKLHLGHSVPLRKLRAFADAGHDVVFLIGSFTAMVGDPGGRDALRQPLSREQVEENFRTYRQQASRILDFSNVEVRYNHEWLAKLTFGDLLQIAGHFTVQQMLHREMFQERMKKGVDLSSTEFLYPLMQGYDSVMLDVDCEIGGSDQLFNMLCGRKLQKASGKRDKFVLTTKLIEGLDGRKMSKTYENCVYIEDDPKDMYGKLMSLHDNLIATTMECVTAISMEEISEAEKAMKKGANPKEFKMRLARNVVTLYHGADAAARAEAEFTRVFSQKGTPDAVPEVKAKAGELLVDVLVHAKCVPSKSEARRLIEQKGIHLNGRVVESVDAKVAEGTVKVGKRKFLKIVLSA